MRQFLGKLFTSLPFLPTWSHQVAGPVVCFQTQECSEESPLHSEKPILRVGGGQEAGLRSEPVWGLEWTPLTLEAMQWERLLHLRFPLFILPQTELYHTSLERVKWHFSF